MNNDYLRYRNAYLEHYGIKGMKWRFSKFTNKIRRGGKDVYEYVRNTGSNTLRNMRLRGGLASAGARIGQGLRNAYNSATGGSGIQGTVNRRLNQMRFKAGTGMVKAYGQRAAKFAKNAAMNAKKFALNVVRNFRNKRAANNTADTLERLRKKYTVSGRAEAYKDYSNKLATYNKIYGTGGRPTNYNQRKFQESGGYNPNNRKKSKVKPNTPMLRAVNPPNTSGIGRTGTNYNQRKFQESGGYNPLYRKKNKKSSSRSSNPYWGRR